MQEKNLKIEDIFGIFKRRWYIAVLSVLIVVAAGVVLKPREVVTPTYEVITKFFFVQDYDFSPDNLNKIDSRTIRTYLEVLKSKNLLREAISDAGSDADLDEMYRRLSLAIINDSNVIQVKLSGENGEDVAKILNAYFERFKNEAKELIPEGNVILLDPIEAPSAPVPVSSGNISYVMLVGLGLIVGIAATFVVELMFSKKSN